MAYSILIAEDDKSIAQLIGLTLSSSGYHCSIYNDGKSAFEAIKANSFHLALLDIMLPGMSGHELFDALDKKNVPTIFVTAKTGLYDRVNGLRLGAEDYITKPFEPLELLARVEVAMRKYANKNNTVRIHDIELDRAKRVVAKGSEIVQLTPKEYELLEFLALNPNVAFSRESLLNKVWGYDFYGSTRTVDTHIQKLRTKLDLSDFIQTVHKIGYRMETGR